MINFDEKTFFASFLLQSDFREREDSSIACKNRKCSALVETNLRTYAKYA